MLNASLADTDWTGADLRDALFQGTNLQGAFMPTAQLTNTIFFDADLSGANLLGVDLSTVGWTNTICPDGTNSDSHGFTCVGHL